MLSETDPHHAGTRDALRRLLAAHPGQPETALAQYQLTLRGQTLSPGALPDRLPETTRRDWRTVVNDNEILAVEEAAALLESSRTDGQGVTRLHSAVAAAITHGKAIKDVAVAAHLTALEVLDAVDAATYPHPLLPVHDGCPPRGANDL
ncbi:hypothetical protein QFZ65_002150 [Arthrobacter sp. B3I9]|uniref:hypothetical protein n=1 Tax=Arthrobacter sp. B3I9 TaxID=3042270 RepID=UPI002793DB6F|nr:hypothetical protein [Arthrobacter sp. B3I9]MDQ0850212.1 hypothetical protein [Arthrobacter sp. B3I9]